jgi:hypothetical protein
MFALGFAITYLLLDDDWIWAKLMFCDYKCLLILIFSVFLICELINFVKALVKTPKPLGGLDKGFSVTQDSDSTITDEWSEYIKNLVSKLLGTNVGQESFALGISGVWGSGKTTFLNSLREELKNNVYLIDFNPWDCDSASQIASDFFNTLVSSLTVSSYQKRYIVKYSKLLAQFNVIEKHANAFASLFGSDISISEAKKKASDVIGNMPLRVVVVIDDLDRLDDAELMEVLTLIRSTANFKNLIYVVAYDKRYITQVLGEIKGSEFIKKIFPLEICLPALDKDTIPNFINRELERCIDSDNSTLEKIKDGINKLQISAYLPTFRDVKRFVSQFCLNLNSFIRSKQINEINVVDFFYIELLQYYDFKAYQFIRDGFMSTSLFEYGFNDRKFSIIYRDLEATSNKYIEEKKNRTEILKDFNEGVSDILKMLFGERNNESHNSIKYPSNFQKYFSYRINRDVISIDDYIKYIKTDKREIKTEVRKLCNSGKALSLWFHLLSHEVDNPSETQMYNLVYSLLVLYEYRKYKITNVFKTLFENRELNNLKVISDALRDAISDYIEEDNCRHSVIQNILTSLVGRYSYDVEDVRYTVYESVLSYAHLEELAQKNFKQILKRNAEHIPIQWITDDTSQLHKFLRSAVAEVDSYTPDGEHNVVIKKSLIINALKEFYLSQNNESGLEPFFRQLDPFKDDPYYYSHYDEMYNEMLIDNIIRVFGDIKDFSKFIYSVFDKEKVDVEVKKLGIKMPAVD